MNLEAMKINMAQGKPFRMKSERLTELRKRIIDMEKRGFEVYRPVKKFSERGNTYGSPNDRERGQKRTYGKKEEFEIHYWYCYMKMTDEKLKESRENHEQTNHFKANA